MNRLRAILLCAVFAATFSLFFSPYGVRAEDYTSASFILRDPVFTDEGGYSTSASFQYTSATGLTNAERNTSVTFMHCAGFLYFPQSGAEPCPDAVTPPPPPPSPTPSPPPPAGGGGGAGGGLAVQTVVNFNGRAYPRSNVVLLKDAQVAAIVTADLDARFAISLKDLSAGSYLFSIYAEDKYSNRSALLTFPVNVANGATTNVNGIFLAPTLALDKAEVKQGDNLVIFGQSSPQSAVSIVVNSEHELYLDAKADAEGVYLYNLNTSPLELGSHVTKPRATLGVEQSSFGKAVAFTVGTKNILAKKTKCPDKGDLNQDCKVNLVDFSIAAYWWRRPLSDTFIGLERAHLSGDGKLTLADFSIMVFYWTG